MQGRSTDYGNEPLFPSKSKGIKIFPYCNKPCHTIEVCFKKHSLPSYLRKVNLAQTLNDDNELDTSSSSKLDVAQDIISFTTEQHCALLALLQ